MKAKDSHAQIEIRGDRCKGCGMCVAFCPTQVFRTGPREVPEVVSSEKCTLCGLCELRCPDFAIRVTDAGKNDEGEKV